eukprot:6209031-Pleurochrysis_carterae.AAC.3
MKKEGHGEKAVKKERKGEREKGGWREGGAWVRDNEEISDSAHGCIETQARVFKRTAIPDITSENNLSLTASPRIQTYSYLIRRSSAGLCNFWLLQA